MFFNGKQKFLYGGHSLNHYEMLEYIKDRLDTASPAEVEALYWMIEMEFES